MDAATRDAYYARTPDAITAEMSATAEQFARAIRPGGLMVLGAQRLSVAPGRHGMGALQMSVRLLPMRRNGERSESPRRMLMLVSLTPADEIDVEVFDIRGEGLHASVKGVYIDMLEQLAVALDYDGPEVLNPSYWAA